MNQQSDGVLLKSGTGEYFAVPFEVLRRFRVAEDRVDDAVKLLERDEANPYPDAPASEPGGSYTGGRPVVVASWCPDWNGRLTSLDRVSTLPLDRQGYDNPEVDPQGYDNPEVDQQGYNYGGYRQAYDNTETR